MSTINRAFLKITPECTNLTKSIKGQGIVGIIIGIMLIIFLIIAAVYINKKEDVDGGAETREGTVEDKNKKIVMGMVVTSIILSIIATIVFMWNFILGKKIAECIDRSNP